MRIRSLLLSLSVATLSLALFLTGCGPQPGNQNTTGNQNTAAVANTAAANAANAASKDAAAATCTDQDDAQIERQIWISIQGDPKLNPQIRHINIDSKYCNVTLYGWVDGWEDFKNIYDKVYNAPGVRKIDVAAFGIASPKHPEVECPEGTYQCRDLCIPVKADCTLPGGGTQLRTESSPSPSPSPK